MALTEGKYTGEFILAEAPGTISRETVTVTVGAGVTFSEGLVLGKITATGKYVAYNNGAADGTEVAAGILYGELKNSTGGALDFKGVIINNVAEVRLADLDWNAQAQGAIDAGVVDLAARIVKARA